MGMYIKSFDYRSLLETVGLVGVDFLVLTNSLSWKTVLNILLVFFIVSWNFFVVSFCVVKFSDSIKIKTLVTLEGEKL